MCNKLFVALLVLLFALAGIASAIEVKIDFGGGGVLDASWTEWNSKPWKNSPKTVDTVTFTLAQANQPNGPSLRVGVGDALTKESLGSDNPGAGGVYTLTITNLPAGDYDLDTYFNNPTTYGAPWPGGGGQEVWVNGTQQAGPSAASYNKTSAEALVLSASFNSSGTSDVITVEWKNSVTPSNWINGFILTPEPATIMLLGLGGLALIRRKR